MNKNNCSESRFGSCIDLNYGLYRTKGYRNKMEDFCYASSPKGLIDSMDSWLAFGIFDGIYSSIVSRHLSICFLPSLISRLSNLYDEYSFNNNLIDDEELIEEIINRHLHYDIKIHKALKKLEKLNRNYYDHIGSTSCGVIITKFKYVFLNLGDSRAVLFTDGLIKFKTSDHRPNNELEKTRIINASGEIKNNKVDNELAVSRAFGCPEYKNSGTQRTHKIIAEPDVTIISRHYRDEIILIANYGFWNFIKEEEAYSIIKFKEKNYSLEVIAKELSNLAISKGSEDNVSVIIIRLKHKI